MGRGACVATWLVPAAGALMTLAACSEYPVRPAVGIGRGETPAASVRGEPGSRGRRLGYPEFPVSRGSEWLYERQYRSSVTTADTILTYETAYTFRSVVGCSVSFSAERSYASISGRFGDWDYGWHHFRRDPSALYVFGGGEPWLLCPDAQGIREDVEGAIASGGRSPLQPEARLPVPDGALRRAWLEHLARFGPAQDLGPRTREPDPDEYERVVLAYPLLPGRSWRLSDRTSVVATVEGFDWIATESGRVFSYRIRLRYPGSPCQLVDRRWYGSAGFVGSVWEENCTIRDEGGQVLGTLSIVDRLRLVRYSIGGSGPPLATRAPEGPMPTIARR